MDILEGAPEAVMDHSINHRSVAHTIAGARPGEEIGCVAHALHAARDVEITVFSLNGLSRQHHRFQARAADLVDGDRGDVIRYTTAKGRLSCWRLARSGGDHMSH